MYVETQAALCKDEELARVEKRNHEFVAMIEEHCPDGGFLFGDQWQNANQK